MDVDSQALYQTFDTQEELISHFEKYKLWHHKEIYEAMRKGDRADFVTKNVRPYDDFPQKIGYGVTISAPHMHGFALHYLFDKIQEGGNILDVGSGSGILCAYIAYLIGEKGKVTGIDHIKELCDFSIKNLNKNNKEYLEKGRIEIICGDGRKGYKANAPYDAIHVGAAASEDVCDELCQQLKPNGKMAIPVEVHLDDEEKENSYSILSGIQWFRIYKKDEKGKISYENVMPVRYVPLTDEKKQRKNV